MSRQVIILNPLLALPQYLPFSPVVVFAFRLLVNELVIPS